MHIRKREIFKSILLLLLVYFFLSISFNDNTIFAEIYYNCAPNEYCTDWGPDPLIEVSIPYYTCSNATCVHQSTNWMTSCTWYGFDDDLTCSQSTAPVRGYYTYDECVADIEEDVCFSEEWYCIKPGVCNTTTGFCRAPIQNDQCSSNVDCCIEGEMRCTSKGNKCGEGASSIKNNACCVTDNPYPPAPPCTPSTSCPDSTCTDSGYSATETSFYSTTKTCSDGCSGTLNKTCWCTGDCPLQNCASGTSTTYTVDTYDTYSCTNDCNKPNSKTCYCDICEPPLCGPAYENSNQGYGTIVLSCRNGNSGTPERDTKCDLTNRTCYCRNCLKNCPSPLLNNNTANPNLKLEDFRRCTNDCDVGPDEANDDCYEVESSQPTEIFSIVDTAVPMNRYDFKDRTVSPYTHSGRYDSFNLQNRGDLNDPTDPIEMIATYTDLDGVSDIEAMFVWFRHEDVTGAYEMPVHISSSATPDGPSQNSWGFMLRDTSTGWKPYVASFQSTPAVWTPASGLATKFFLPADDQANMVEVTIENITENIQTKSITLRFSLRFSNMGNPFVTKKASEGKYKILLMGLDKFSFTPYDNYDFPPQQIDFDSFWDPTYLLNGEDFTHYWSSSQLRYVDGVQNYARNWTDTGKTWMLDFQDPQIITFSKEIIENSIKVSWNVKDDRNLYAIVGNIYVSGSDQKPLTLYDATSGVTLRDDDSSTEGSQILPLGPDNNTTLIGKLNKDSSDRRTWSFRVAPDLSTDSHTGSVTIGIGDNTIGELSVYLTVFDDAGNVITSYPALSENLADRFLTEGGLAFSPSTTFAELPILNTSTWTNILPPYSTVSGGLDKNHAGFTSEMYADFGNPLNSIQARSYGISGFTNWLQTPSLYDSLFKKYELHKKYIEAELTENKITSSQLSSLPECFTTYCTYNRSGNLNVNSGLLCNKKALVFVNGNLIIKPPIESDNSTTLSNTNGCIFVVKGTVTIEAGSRASTSTTFGYDKINAYIISDDVVTIQHDPYISPYNPKKIVDGVYINGGLISRGGGDSIDISRYLRLNERLVYPVFAIDLHPKYGMLAEKFFGNSYVIQQTEVGLKPY